MSISGDSWRNILDYVGTGNYIFVSPVSTFFYKEYDKKNGGDNKKKTSRGNVLSSLTRFNNSTENGFVPSYKDFNILASQTFNHNCSTLGEALLDRGVMWDTNSMMFASEHGNRRYISWAISRNVHCTMNTLFKHLSRFGQVEIMKWLYKMGNIPHDGCLLVAANYNHISVLDWLLSIDSVKPTPAFISLLAENGYIDTLKWALNEKGFICDNFTLNCAAAGGSLEIVKYLLKFHDVEVTKETVYSACSSGSNSMNVFMKNNYEHEYTENMLDILERYSL